MKKTDSTNDYYFLFIMAEKRYRLYKFSEIIGINSYILGEIERGEKHASLDVLFKFANHFNLKIHELINIE